MKLPSRLSLNQRAPRRTGFGKGGALLGLGFVGFSLAGSVMLAGIISPVSAGVSGGSELPIFAPLVASLASGTTLSKILADPIAVVELIALLFASLYLFSLIVGKSACESYRIGGIAALGESSDMSSRDAFATGQAVKLGAPAPSVRRANRSGASVSNSVSTSVVNVGGVITRAML